ncbi:family 78 glycoside hydrolase catalytic domain [Phycicoccus sp. BSK3Z-2]|uniref:alpha-L-rhamnosidase n=1 Tax=Phycicoccus avicenniae TaxID=2828860 RepID=A0A941HYE6_9MICO|nr:family 78 glycoside hydrolase catalytic domain [Phycicoccus avicenniae]MBR7741757.1 family 78 glycoside hydrolase catalytic domain [Phycicoccus avicenniae]
MTPPAQMIAPDDDLCGAPLLRKAFALEPGHGDVVSARLLVTALGVVEATLNGEPVSEDVLTPGWSSYEWRLRQAEVDVLAMLRDTNVLGLRLGNGWARGRLGWTGGRALYTDELGALAELTVRYADGHEQVVQTDGTWRAGPSDTTSNDLYDGQTIDAGRRTPGWDAPGFDDAGWSGVHVLPFDHARLTPYVGPPVVRHEEVPAQRVWTSPSGRTLVDFGQNLVGWVRLSVTGPAGHEIVLRHAEVLEDGELGTRPLRSARATDRYVLSGAQDRFEPTLTLHGFRYVEVEGWPGEVRPEDLVAVVVGSRVERTGRFECSSDLLTRFHRNVVWGMRGNFVDVPTDCPQRDERLGWTGDISVFAPTAAYLFDVADFLRDWLADLAAEQRHADGVVPFVVPDTLKSDPFPFRPDQLGATAVWGDAAVWVPWALWWAYGDEAVVRDQLGSMLGHLRRVQASLSPTGVWDTGFQFGDWLDPDAPPDDPARAKADPGVVATACAHRTASMLERMASAVGADDVAREAGETATALREAFGREYVRGGRVHSDCVTVYALTLVFGLLDEEDRTVAGERLDELVRESGHLISTGFAGTPFVLDALTDTGHLDTAYGLLMQQECPSWLYPVTMGATTVWERWDSMLPDGSVNPGEMTSFNHYALGAVADWMHRTVGGLAPAEPGYRRILVRPRPGGGLTRAETSLDTPHGRAAVAWRVDGDALLVDVEVPEGTVAVVMLPGRPEEEVGPGRHHLRGDAVAGTEVRA